MERKFSLQNVALNKKQEQHFKQKQDNNLNQQWPT
jgi:hypothetical protein